MNRKNILFLVANGIISSVIGAVTYKIISNTVDEKIKKINDNLSDIKEEINDVYCWGYTDGTAESRKGTDTDER